MKEYYLKNKGSKNHAFSRWLFDSLLFLLEKKPVDIYPKKILIIDNGHIGDVIMSTSTFREIKKVYPNAEVTVICSKIANQILEKNQYIDKIISMDFFWRKEARNWLTFWEYLALICRLRKENYDIGISLRSDLPNILTLWLSKIIKRCAYYNLDGGKPFLTNPLSYPDKEIHASVADLNLVNFSLGMEAKDSSPEIGVDIFDDANWKHLFGEYFCIVPGACAKLQTWSKENYIKLIEWLSNEYPEHKILLCGGSSDEKLINELSLISDKCIKMINQNLRVIGLIFDGAEFVLLQDGGPMHLAYTMMKEADKKLFILWGPNPLEHVAPLSGQLIHHKLDCYPCMRQEKLCKKPEGERCMDLITVDEVKSRIEKYLKGREDNK